MSGVTRGGAGAGSGTITVPQPLPRHAGSGNGSAGANPEATRGTPTPHTGPVGTTTWDGPASTWFAGAVADHDARHALDGPTLVGGTLGAAVGGGAVLGMGMLEASSAGRGASEVRIGVRIMAGVVGAAMGGATGLVSHWGHARNLDEGLRSTGRRGHPQHELAARSDSAERADDGPSALDELVHLKGKGVDVTLVQQGDERSDPRDFDEALDDARADMVQSTLDHDGVVAYAVVRDDGGFIKRARTHVVALTEAPGSKPITATSGITPEATADGVQAVVTDSATWLRTNG